MRNLAVSFACVFTVVASAAFFVSAAEKTPTPPEQINKLVKQLGDKDYFARQQAQDELARLGFEAFDAVNAAADDADVEISSRAKYLLKLMSVEWTTDGDPAEVRKCLHDYEMEDPQTREARMQMLAGLPDAQGATALCRLIRFEKSLFLSKAAAVALLGSRSAVRDPKPATLEAVSKSLKNCKRPAAAWVLVWTRLAAGQETAFADLNKLIEDERKLLAQSPKTIETSPAIISGLVRFQIFELKKFGKIEEAMACISRLIELEQGSAETLAELLAWLVEQKAWKAIDDIARRFAGQFAGEPGLLYILAEAYDMQGKTDLAKQTADRAFRLNSSKQNRLQRHLLAAYYLRARGRFDWARKEFEYIIEQTDGSENDDTRVMAQTMFAEMLHDQSQDEEAAAVLQKLVAAIDAKKVTEGDLNGRDPKEIRSRLHYFSACNWAAKKDAAKQREALDQALNADPADVDVLIACYKLSGQPPEYRKKIQGLIKKAADGIREDMTDNPDDSSPYNQFAWLIGNTEGDFDEAIKCSLKSLELCRQSPESKTNEGGLYDTLAHIYFTKGDLDNAVKYQAKAAELDPHSGLIRRELKLFREKQQEKKK